MASFHSFVKPNHCDVLIWSDPGADADDEVAIREAVRNNINFTLCIGGRGKLSHWQSFKSKDTSKSLPAQRGEEYENGVFPDHKIAPKHIVLIAPGIDKHLNRFDFSRLQNVFYQGNCPVKHRARFRLDPNFVADETEAFNDNGSREFFKQLNGSVTVHAITTAESNQTLFSETLFDSIKLPDEQREIVRANTFNQLLGRMNPQHTYNKFAEGLINPNIKGGNYKMAEKLLRATRNQTIEDLPEASASLTAACQDYVDKLGDKATRREETLVFLIDLSRMVHAISEFEPVDDDGTLIVSGKPDGTPFTLNEKYADQYQNFKSKVKTYTPAFDLVAMQRMIAYYNSH